MKKNILLCAILLVTAQLAFAVPAKKGKIIRVQPDGTTITLQLHGDEFLHWTTREDGTVVAPDAKGFYVPAAKPKVEQLGGRMLADMEAAAIRAKRAASNSLLLASGSYKTYHFPVVLVQFSDVQFKSETANSDFSRLLNEEGYSDNGGTGSVRDFYWENSMGTFLAEFDVFGPFTYTGKCEDNAEENDAAKILWDAISKNDSSIDWSKYDNDGDGSVDMVFMYYAGYNEAEGAANTIWPHKFNFSSAGVSTKSLDGKSFSVYACTSELKGTSGENMCGIGTCAHEFSHTQGLPDFYDVNYDNYGDGEAGATYDYDIMCSGSYNNAGRTPPYFTAEERIMMGWLSGYEDLPENGEIVIPAVNTNFAYKMATSNTTGSGEYFIFECRSGQGWDAYVEPGLIVYHVDKSQSYNVTFKTSTSSSHTFTPYQLWTNYSQYVNASGSHPCFYIVPAAEQDNLNYGSSRKLPFPGQGHVSFYSPADWAGNTAYGLFSDIAFHSDGSEHGFSGTSVVSLTRGENYKGVCGFITNAGGEPIEGATINIYSASVSSSSNVIQKISGRILENLKTSVTTDENGYYSINLGSLDDTKADIEVVADGYITKYEGITLEDKLQDKSFTMRSIDSKIDYTLRKYDLSDGGLYLLGYGETCTSYGSIRYTADELAPYAGRKILKLGFAYSLRDEATVSSVYGIIDFGGSRQLTSKVSEPAANAWNVVDVSDKNLYIPSGTDCYFGYGLITCTDGYPLLFSNNNPQEGGFNYYLSSSTSVESTAFTWNDLSSRGNLMVYVVLDDSSEVNYNYIDNPGYGNYKVGDTFALTLVEAEGDRKPGSEIQWFFDDEPVSGESIVLKYAGYHVVEARFTTTDGKASVVELEINVNL